MGLFKKFGKWLTAEEVETANQEADEKLREWAENQKDKDEGEGKK